MDMKTYWSGLSPDEKRDLAGRCDTSVAYLSQVVNGHRQAGRDLVFRFERETDNAVTRHDMRPDWFGAPSRTAA